MASEELTEHLCRECGTSWTAPINYCPQCGLYLDSALSPSETRTYSPGSEVPGHYEAASPSASAIEAVGAPDRLVKIDDGRSVHVRSIQEWLDLARRDFESRRSSIATPPGETRTTTPPGETPRTDAIHEGHGGYRVRRETAYYSMKDHARQLERELAGLQEKYAYILQRAADLDCAARSPSATACTRDTQRLDWLMRNLDEPALFQVIPQAADLDGVFTFEAIRKHIDAAMRRADGGGQKP